MLNKVELETGLRVVAENTRPAIVVRQAPMRREGVIIHSRPNTRLPSKDWGLTRWERLAEILNGFGIPLIQVGAPGEGLLPHVLDKRGIAPKEVPELVAHAQLVICLVGFLMHVAAGTETPALVIYGGREHPAIDGYSGQFHLSSDALDCRGRWGCHLAPDMECPYSMRCMNDITPDMVGRLASLAILGSSGKNFK
jgi:ADP-heptose:LPS heptosyltransferase